MPSEPLTRKWTEYVGRFSVEFELTNHKDVVAAELGVIPVEGLNLSGIAPGEYTLYCLPLKLVGADGAPARAILVEA